ncbi:MAG: hypothetical protein KIS29_10355 [Thermoplasmata archaeon]|nr:hypothetical protein [Candidatus Sysuiplasma jiujiangense]
MPEFRTVTRNGRKRVIPVTKRKLAPERKASARDLMRWPPEKISRIARLEGFVNSSDEPFEFSGSPREFSINGMRLSGIDRIYLGEESVSFYSSGKESATVFYFDIGSFNTGGKARIGGRKK